MVRVRTGGDTPRPSTVLLLPVVMVMLTVVVISTASTSVFPLVEATPTSSRNTTSKKGELLAINPSRTGSSGGRAAGLTATTVEGSSGSQQPAGSSSTSMSTSSSEFVPNDNATMGWKAWVFVGIVFCLFIGLLLQVAPMFAIIAFAGLILFLTGIITADQLFSGFVNNGVLAIAMLFVVVHPIVGLPAMKVMVKWILGEVPKNDEERRKAQTERSARIARFKLCLLCMLTSPFLENTPQAAMFTPLVTSYCREIGVAPSQMVMPMNVAVLLGNWALLGSSSNVIIAGMMEEKEWGTFGFFEMTRVNLCLIIPVLLYCVFMPPLLLPKRRGGVTFYFHIKVTTSSPYVGMRVSALLASFLEVRKDDVDKVVVIKANGRRLAEPFSRLVTLEPGDELILAGLVDTLKEARRTLDNGDGNDNRPDASARQLDDLEANPPPPAPGTNSASTALLASGGGGGRDSDAPRPHQQSSPTTEKQHLAVPGSSSSFRSYGSSSVATGESNDTTAHKQQRRVSSSSPQQRQSASGLHGGGSSSYSYQAHSTESGGFSTYHLLEDEQSSHSPRPKGSLEAYGMDLIRALFFGHRSKMFPTVHNHSNDPTVVAHDTMSHYSHHHRHKSRGMSRRKTTFAHHGSFCELDFSDATKLVLLFCKEIGVVLMSLKVSKEGSDLLADKVAYAMAPTASTVSSAPFPRSLAQQQEHDEDEDSHHHEEGERSLAAPQEGQRLSTADSPTAGERKRGIRRSTLQESGGIRSSPSSGSQSPTSNGDRRRTGEDALFQIDEPIPGAGGEGNSHRKRSHTTGAVLSHKAATRAPTFLESTHPTGPHRESSFAAQRMRTPTGGSVASSAILDEETIALQQSSGLAVIVPHEDDDDRDTIVDEDAIAAPTLTLSEKHRLAGGKFFSFTVPSWFPLGTVEIPEKKIDDDEDPAAIKKAIQEGKTRKVLHFPWFYQYLSLLVFIGIIIASVFHIELKISSMIACVAVVLLRLITTKELAKALPVEIFLLIGFCFPLGIGMKESGLADVVAELVVSANMTGFPLLVLLGIITLLLTNTITNQGSVQVLLPLVVHVYRKQGEDPMPGVVMMATVICCAVCTPFAIPANAIIVSPGGYRAKDFLLFGVPLAFAYLVLTAVFVVLFYEM